VFDYRLDFQSLREDERGVFSHESTYLNLRKRDLYLGFFEQRTNLNPLRSQFEEFDGVKIRKRWLDRHETTLAFGQRENKISGRSGIVTYKGQLYEARQQLELTDGLDLTGAFLYTEDAADPLELSQTTGFPRENFVSFGSVDWALSEAVSVSGQLARSDYEADERPAEFRGGWNWRTQAAWAGAPYHVRFWYEFVDEDYVSVGDPATYQDFGGWNLYGDLALLDNLSVAGSVQRYRDNVQRRPDQDTLENQTLTLSSTFRPTERQSLTLTYSNFLADPFGPTVSSSNRTNIGRADYLFPFLLKTNLLASYQLLRTTAPAASDLTSHTAGGSLFGTLGRGATWSVREQYIRTFNEDTSDTLGLSTDANLSLSLHPRLSTYATTSWNRNVTGHDPGEDVLSGALGMSAELLPGTSLNLEYEVNRYDVDAESGPPRDWSLFVLLRHAFGFSTPPNFGAVEGLVFEDRDGNGRVDAGEPPVAQAAVRLGAERQRVTDATGRFTFGRLAPGTHEILLDLGGLDPTLMLAEPVQQVRVRKRRTTTIHFPLIEGASVSGRVFIDENADGLLQDAEEPLDGAAVILLPGEEFRRTDGDGAFRFEHLLPGTYRLRVHEADLPTGYELASAEPREATLAAGEERQEVDFAVRLIPVAVQRFGP